MRMDLTYQDYETPEQLASDANLSRDEKIRLLECWAVDEEALARAAVEGLSGGEQGRLAQVQKVLMELEGEAE